ncbi:Retrovirus-related Pol polyprotein from transposon TNT 1-94 [Senna tora]|uniref:Retrovirus-related Pol polyprotein from transposon TNT 1-94 n=1 Tax=Senna tora TaxID=362788 RepID=A0A834TIA0_9FABA|nr:Retrovirus-related Pol polyprotein from transposon TNT 1-94 [Senna tora]KAF7822716.1 Retrovirus-related Pol polyprotein from transposon TNT 1-94 [Senna tora]KAF7822717.1 Retrovirus-related Pol polyprotein from transposon TNT 1-94 [Senna tora]KAF7822718.1 Retrovirus-related Pol polyprotein from transposon TNT 1-94 [Senna tora]
MMNKQMLKGLPQLEVRDNVVCDGCQYECMKTTVHIINRLPQANLGFVSSYEKLWQVKPTVSHFRVFGCVCYAFVPDHLRSKFDKKAVRCIFVGYDNERKGWRCCDPTTGRCYVSKNVVFDEASSWWSPQITVLLDSKEIEEKLQEKASDGEDDERQKSSPVNAGDNHTREKSPWKTGVHVTAEDARPSQFEEPEEIRGETHPPQQELRRSTRQRKPNPKYTNIALVEDGRSNELARKHQRTKNGRTTKR